MTSRPYNVPLRSPSRPVLRALAIGLAFAAAGISLRAAAQSFSAPYAPVNYALEKANSSSANQVGTAAAQAKGANGKGVEIAVLDSGVTPTHQELVGRIDTTRAWNAV